MVISIAMAAAVVSLADGRLRDVRIAVGSCSPVAARLPQLEARMAGLRPDEAAGLEIPGSLLAPLAPINDIRGSAEYRAEAVKELCRRAVSEALPNG